MTNMTLDRFNIFCRLGLEVMIKLNDGQIDANAIFLFINFNHSLHIVYNFHPCDHVIVIMIT